MERFFDHAYLAPPIVNVSVICANYNHARYLPDMIDSIHQSTVRPEELIIVDDGSTDNSLEILDAYSHLDYLKVISLPENRGQAAALNEALKLASQKYIMRIDSDDYLDHTRIEKQFTFLEIHPEVAVVGTNVTYFENKTGKLINHSNYPIGMEKIQKRFKGGGNGVLHGTVMMRRQALQKLRYNPGVEPSTDYELFSRMTREGYRFQNLRESLTFMRIYRDQKKANKFAEIKMNFKLRYAIFGARASKLAVYTYYIHIHFYHKYLFETHSFLRYIYLTVSSLFRPGKLWRRLSGW